GKVILYDDTLKEIMELVKAEIKRRDKNANGSELEKRAKKIAIGAIKYSMLKQSPNKSIIFNEEDVTQFEGDTGPYLQYSYARASSILKKAKTDESRIKSIKVKSLEFHEIELVKKLEKFSDVISNAYRQLNPSSIANYAFQIAQIFNEFYHTCPVVNSEKETQKQRLAIVQAFRIVMKNALWLLGIEAIEEM
ncbi:arginine--tRNA ligase, partial [Candidatus Pacearchaeota archaeon]|nr:arginine--tRNA ligase [Candidatus Pacearchaeota archaeon]